jgi:uncharacterized membrane protein YdjX (TVP38/TMEM64 family)
MALTNRTATASRRAWRGAPKLLALLVVVAVLVSLWILLPVSEWVIALTRWVRASGLVGVAVFVATYVVATVALAPGAILTLTAGFVWGPFWGTLIVLPTATLAAVSAFTVGRFMARDWVARKVAGNARFAALDRAVGAEGFRIVLLLRLSPIFPFNLLNYALGLTDVRLTSYALASLVGMLPGTAMYVYLGSLVTSASELTAPTDEGSAARSILYWAGLVATLVVTLLVTRIARRELKKSVPDAREGGGGDRSGST